MKILLDECLPWPMHRLLSNHTCTSVQAEGWSGIRNGDLLERAEGRFELFITSDQNIRYQGEFAIWRSHQPLTHTRRSCALLVYAELNMH
jgi:hypothetical protein